MDHLYTRPFALCALANFAQAVSFSLFLHFPGFLKELGAGESEIGVLVALTALSTVVLGPFCGRLMDRQGRRPVIIGGNLLNVGVVGFYMTLPGLSPAMYVVRVFHGVAGMMLYSALFTYAADIVPPARTAQGLALFGVSAMLSIMVGGVIVPLWLVTWMFFFAQAGVFTFLKTYVVATGFGTLGAFFTVYTLTAIVQRLGLGWVPDCLGLTRVLGPALLAFVVGLLLLSMAGSAWQVWTAALFCGVGHGYAFPILLGLVSRCARVTERGTAMAIYTTIDDGAVLMAGPLLGFLIETMGYAPMFWSVAGLLAGTTVLFLLWDRRRQEVPSC